MVIQLIVFAVSAAFASVMYRWVDQFLENGALVDGLMSPAPASHGVSRLFLFAYCLALILSLPFGWRMIRRERNLCVGIMFIALGGTVIQHLMLSHELRCGEAAPFAAVLFAEVYSGMWRRRV